MIAGRRDAFNASFSETAFLRARRVVEEAAGGAIPFRLAESPLFLPGVLLREMGAATEAILAEVFAHPEYAERVRRHVPAEAFSPPTDDHPPFVQCDFALVEDGGGIAPRVIEIQGFPSLYAFQHALGRAYREAFAVPAALELFGPGVDDGRFLSLFRQAVLGDHDPASVALVDVHPWRQGTWPDFRFTERLFPGLSVVSATDVVRRGDRLFRRDEGGREVRIERIFNRMVWEDVQKAEADMEFRLGEPLDVEWAAHPGWFFQLSKLVLPLVSHPSVPRSYFLDEHPVTGADLHRYVLKPLFSFAGKGLVLDLDEATLDAIPEGERSSFVLQEKVHYADVMTAPDGRGVRCELRLMFLWVERPVLVLVLPRMSRGRLMGCAFNTADPWTGHGVAFWEG